MHLVQDRLAIWGDGDGGCGTERGPIIDVKWMLGLHLGGERGCRQGDGREAEGAQKACRSRHGSSLVESVIEARRWRRRGTARNLSVRGGSLDSRSRC